MNNNKDMNFEIQTMHYERLLVAIDDDDTASSIKALNYACTVAKVYQIPLGIVSILETSDLNIYQSMSPKVLADRRLEIKEDLNLYVDKVHDFGINDVTPIVDEGNPSRVIIDKIIPNFKPDLLIVGSKTKPSKHLIGSHASYMAKNAPCSVIVVR